ncbi:aminotransferase-like domain-containing protein [Mesorhizobium koreense]|uniref:aminotransferase-like domain-containing protein n=1 Tax=Mesorhizobium koreense TaxID=3074855 RepID=UPI00287B7E31|nr:PLP-dependent aminotransferase family protein [Mesorhizobium sp. WR6]
MRDVLRDIFDDTAAARSALQYGPSEGDMLLRQRLCSHMALRGVRCEPANILLTSGAQQALNLVSEAFVDPDDTVLVQSPTYPGALQVFLAHGARLAGLDARTAAPSLIYAMSNFQNPTGVSLSLGQRQHLVALAHQLDTVLIEDDPYEALLYDGEALPSLLSIDVGEHSIEDARTLYFGTFSKSIAPGLRIGWVVGPALVVEKLALLKQTEDLQANSLAQAALGRLLAHGVEPFARPIQVAYRERRERMAEALRGEFGNRGAWSVPQGGFFFWLTLPMEIDTAAMLRHAAQLGVTYVPGIAFSHSGSGANTLRLSFSSAQPDRISEGVRRLAKAFDEHAS